MKKIELIPGGILGALARLAVPAATYIAVTGKPPFDAPLTVFALLAFTGGASRQQSMAMLSSDNATSHA